MSFLSLTNWHTCTHMNQLTIKTVFFSSCEWYQIWCNKNYTELQNRPWIAQIKSWIHISVSPLLSLFIIMNLPQLLMGVCRHFPQVKILIVWREQYYLSFLKLPLVYKTKSLHTCILLSFNTTSLCEHQPII